MRSSDPAAAAADPAAGSVVETVTFDWGLSGVSSTPITASRGSWVPLPESTTATGAPVVTKESGENLCGFAITKAFPVAIAKRQVANDWGAQEARDSTNRITAVFIRTGGSIVINGPPRLYSV